MSTTPPARPRTTRTMLIMLGVGAVALVACIVVVIVLVLRGSAHAEKLDAYTAAATAADIARVELEAETARADGMTEPGADASAPETAMWSALERARTVGAPSTLPDAESAPDAELETATAALQAFSRAAHEAAVELADAHAAWDEDRLATARTALTMALDAARTAFTDSTGDVADEGVRTALGALVDEAAVLLESGEDPAQLDDARDRLQKQVDAVAKARKPHWTDINGTWCRWNDASYCVTINIPTVVFSDGLATIATREADDFRNGCFFGGVFEDVNSGAAMDYCLVGGDVGDDMTPFDNRDYERLYITQGAGSDPYFRDDELKDAVR